MSDLHQCDKWTKPKCFIEFYSFHFYFIFIYLFWGWRLLFNSGWPVTLYVAQTWPQPPECWDYWTPGLLFSLKSLSAKFWCHMRWMKCYLTKVVSCSFLLPVMGAKASKSRCLWRLLGSTCCIEDPHESEDKMLLRNFLLTSHGGWVTVRSVAGEWLTPTHLLYPSNHHRLPGKTLWARVGWNLYSSIGSPACPHRHTPMCTRMHAPMHLHTHVDTHTTFLKKWSGLCRVESNWSV